MQGKMVIASERKARLEFKTNHRALSSSSIEDCDSDIGGGGLT
jgi:hypothetical protein